MKKAENYRLNKLLKKLYTYIYIYIYIYIIVLYIYIYKWIKNTYI